MVTLYNVISKDGFIARRDGSEDFIPDDMWPQTLELFRRYDTLVQGKGAYEALQEYDAELLKPFENLSIKKIVVTRDTDLVPRGGYQLAHSPEDALVGGGNILVCSGPGLNTSLLEKGLVDKIILHKLPITIGEGMEPFPKKIYETMADKIEIDEKA